MDPGLLLDASVITAAGGVIGTILQKISDRNREELKSVKQRLTKAETRIETLEKDLSDTRKEATILAAYAEAVRAWAHRALAFMAKHDLEFDSPPERVPMPNPQTQVSEEEV